MEYDFVNDLFTTYESVPTPKVNLNLPLSDTSTDISDWATGFASNGTPIVKDTFKSKFTVDNKEEVPIVVPYSINSGVTGSKKQALEFFINKGLKPHQAAGIVGNLMQESGLRTDSKGDGGKAFGLAQWHPDRQVGLKNLAKKMGTQTNDFNTQLEYVWQELNTSHKTALDKIINSRNVDEATTMFMRHFERPNEKLANLTGRIKYAQSLLK